MMNDAADDAKTIDALCAVIAYHATADERWYEPQQDAAYLAALDLVRKRGVDVLRKLGATNP